MSRDDLRVATRGSRLALWQAEHVAAGLREHHPGLEVTLVPLSTRGDAIQDRPLQSVGGKGLFIKELERALLEDEADLAVHSVKDVPAEVHDDLHLPVITARGSPLDAFLAVGYDSLEALPQGARLGTSSLRRQAQMAAVRPDLRILGLRGNVNTRLAKLERGEFDAIVLAAAGLERLGMAEQITEYLPPERSLPAIGQGALGLECRRGDTRTAELIEPLTEPQAALTVGAERAMNARLHGDCNVPLAGYAAIDDDGLWLRGLVASPDGQRVVQGEIRGARDEAETLGRRLAEDLLDRGAAGILAELGVTPP